MLSLQDMLKEGSVDDS